MNRKILISFIVIIIFIIGVVFLFTQDEEQLVETPSIPVNKNEEKTVEVIENEQINKIKTDSFLNILLEIRTFDSLNVNYETLLEAAMRIAGELELYQVPEDGVYIEYVPREIVHELIFELSGIRITEPIIIEDHYYLYNAENDYYYIVPIGANWLKLKEINSIKYTANSNQHVINCSAENLSDYAIKTTYPDVEVRLKYKANNTYIKYQLISINTGKSTTEIITPDENTDFSENHLEI